MRNFISIDPGIHSGFSIFFKHINDVKNFAFNTGIFDVLPVSLQFFSSDKTEFQTLPFNVDVSRESSLYNRFNILTKSFEKVLKTVKIEKCVIETPSFWPSSLVSNIAVGKSSLFLVSNIIGVYVGLCCLNDIKVKMITPVEWKGQLNKKQIQRRVEQVYNLNDYFYKNEHVNDAIGIGLNELGLL